MRAYAESMTYSGFSDFGDTATASDDLVDHGLVFAFRSFDHYSQPIAVFASKGPTNGTILVQLILKAIFRLRRLVLSWMELFVMVLAPMGSWKAFTVR